MQNVGKFLFLLLGLVPLVEAQPTRVVTLSPVAAEWVSEILGEKDTRARLVGVSEFSHFPIYVASIPSIGPYPQIHVEEVIKLKPDLVIAVEASNRPDQIEKLKRLKLPVTVLKKEKFDEMGDWISELGKALGEEKRAKSVRDRWEFEVKALEPKGESSSVFVQIQSRPLITIGGGSFITAAFKRVGLNNVFEGLTQDYPKVSREAVMKHNPDQIWILDLTGDRNEFEKSRTEWERFESLKAVKNGKVRILKGDEFARCSMRLLKALKLLK